MTFCLYLTRNGLLEPLGQSQVFAYLRGLSRDYRITLITYEKEEDQADTARVEALRAECESLGISWLPQRFSRKPRVVAPALSMVHMFWLVWREVRAGRAELIHARSYIPAAVALAIHKLSGVPFIFDMRALWPEELITAGRLTRGSSMHRAIVWIERACLRRSSEDMPDAVRGHDLSLMFYAGGEISELGRSPTRMAEVLACGLPVVANEGVGDVADIVRRKNIGVIVEGAALMICTAIWRAHGSSPKC
jgi:glycosyltransferase involved in cell wall biosynthesis